MCCVSFLSLWNRCFSTNHTLVVQFRQTQFLVTNDIYQVILDFLAELKLRCACYWLPSFLTFWQVRLLTCSAATVLVYWLNVVLVTSLIVVLLTCQLADLLVFQDLLVDNTDANWRKATTLIFELLLFYLVVEITKFCYLVFWRCSISYKFVIGIS